MLNASILVSSHILDVLESDDEDIHQLHLRPPAGTPCQSVHQIVVVLLGRVVVQLLQGKRWRNIRGEVRMMSKGNAAGRFSRSEVPGTMYRSTKGYWCWIVIIGRGFEP